ncbi:uncharacterized protein N7518_002677 [Penicillium psychrosexuale]|uniref:uncharacterized protein n=1 Tax=Penicillium psychrosexuale TaxID=1002107 RepID=UPI002545BA18|nr:uncharacterized protein N7518_002677 [Penicillium psychrosexuale]KAJ5800609.1 hypothetical protein N7518_002677 [Penicillium psychrosexuale]
MALNPTPITSGQAVQSPLPELFIASHRTTTSAMHDIAYIGNLAQWPNFTSEVSAKASEPWSSVVVDLEIQARDIKREDVYIADEMGLRGRFQQSVGQVLGTVFRAENVNIRFADFKSAGIPYRKTPDIALVRYNRPFTLKAVGELKVPWIDDHGLAARRSDDSLWRATIGQVAEYMIDKRVPYGFHSTYTETVFLRYICVNGMWRMEYSPIIDNEGTGVSVKQCFWYFSSLALGGRPIRDRTDKDDLISRD